MAELSENTTLQQEMVSASGLTVPSQAVKFYSPELARLDHLYKCFWKMFISHLLCLQPYPGFHGMLHYNGHPVQKVDVMGVVVYRDEKQKCYIYGVDDGTGVIQVCQLKRKPPEEVNEDTDDSDSELFSSLDKALSSNQTGGEFQNLEHGFELDDLLHVRGHLKTFRERNEIFAYYLAKVNDPMREVLHMRERMQLYKKFYTQPVRIPVRIQQTMSGVYDERDHIRQIAKEVRHCLLQDSTNRDLVLVYVQDLLTVPSLEKLASQVKSSQITTLFQDAMCLLEEQGVVYQDSSFDFNSHQKYTCWKIVEHDTKLHSDILCILKKDRETQEAKYGVDFKGTYFLRVLKLLAKDKDYKNMKEACVRSCLEYLDEQAKVYGGAYKGYYLPFDG